jgi:parallel beta-helix repeat protein
MHFTDDHFGGIPVSTHGTNLSTPSSGFLPHEPILITSDSDFASQGWPGSGTPGDPYRIENLEIVRVRGNSIEVRDTTAYFRVGNCVVTGNDEGNGIYLLNTVNGVLDSNRCERGDYGIRLDYCQYIDLVANLCSRNAEAGLYLHESKRNSVSGNVCEYNPQGIRIAGGSSNDVSGNTCARGASGLVLDTSQTASVHVNEFVFNGVGIHLRDASNNNLTANTCEYNSERGVLLVNSHFNLINSNIISENQEGLRVTRSLCNDIRRNSFLANRESGIYLYLSEQNRAEMNTLSGSKYGVYAVAAPYSIIADNTVSDNSRAGILLVESNLGSITDNVFVNCGLELQGELYLRQLEVTGNTVNGRALIFWQYQETDTVPSGAGQVILLYCRNIVVQAQVLSYSSIGLLMFQSSFVTVSDTLFVNNSWCGVELWNSDSCTFSENSFLENGQYGIAIHYGCLANSVRRNTFIDNAVRHAIDDGALDVFDRNFWSDYLGSDKNLDGLGDDPYLISGRAENRDRNPLMAPPGVDPPGRMIRWILTVVGALVANAVLIGIALSVALHRRNLLTRFGASP